MNEPKPNFSNSAYLFPPINKEGKRFGSIAIALTFAILAGIGFFIANPIVAGVFGFFAAILSLLTYGVFLFFRDPVRYPPEDEKAILSPADGRICLIREIPLPEDAFGG